MARKNVSRILLQGMQGSGRVFDRLEVVSSSYLTEISVETMGPKCEVKTEKVAPVSTRKVMDLPAAWSITLGLGEGDGNLRI